MTKKLLIPIFLLATMFVAKASIPAVDFTGHWRGQFMGQYDIHYEFKLETDGTTVTGKAYSLEGTTSDIKDGKLVESKLTYTASIAGEMVPVTGLLHDDTLTLSFVVQGFEVVVDLKKAEK